MISSTGMVAGSNRLSNCANLTYSHDVRTRPTFQKRPTTLKHSHGSARWRTPLQASNTDATDVADSIQAQLDELDDILQPLQVAGSGADTIDWFDAIQEQGRALVAEITSLREAAIANAAATVATEEKYAAGQQNVAAFKAALEEVLVELEAAREDSSATESALSEVGRQAQWLQQMHADVIATKERQDRERQAAEDRYSELCTALAEIEEQLANMVDSEHVEALETQLAAARHQAVKAAREAERLKRTQPRTEEPAAPLDALRRIQAELQSSRDALETMALVAASSTKVGRGESDEADDDAASGLQAQLQQALRHLQANEDALVVEAEQEVTAAQSAAAEKEAELADAAGIAELLAEELGRQQDAATAISDDLTFKIQELEELLSSAEGERKVLQHELDAARSSASEKSEAAANLERRASALEAALEGAHDTTAVSSQSLEELRQQMRDIADAEAALADETAKLELASLQAAAEKAAASAEKLAAEEALAAAIASEESLAARQAGASSPDSANSTPVGDRLQETAELRDQVEALLEQLSAEADLGSASLDRAESAEAEAAQLRLHLQQQEGISGDGSAAEALHRGTLQELAAVKVAAAAAMAQAAELRRHNDDLLRQLAAGQAAEPAAVASQSLWGSSAVDKKLASVTERVEQLEGENESLRVQADGRAQVLVLSKQFISSYLERTSHQPQPAEVQSSNGVMPPSAGAQSLG